MGTQGNFGFVAATNNLTTNVNSAFITGLSKINTTLTAVRVKYILLDDSDPVKFNILGGWNGLGAIQYEPIENPTVSLENNIAFPISPNNKNFPLLNEIVYIIEFPDNNIGDTNVSKKAYYINNIGIWNHPHHNAYPLNSNNPSPSQQKDYIETSIGSVRRVTDKSTEINLGKTFIERANIHPLLPFEGDLIYEGRWGNSIRLGSTVKKDFRGNNWSEMGLPGDPITIIRNGQGNQSEKGWVPIIENINTDDSSIYLASTQQIPLDVASRIYYSYPSNPPTSPNKYAGSQIILNSGRLVFNSWLDHILLSSNKSINFNAIESVNIDTVDLSIKANNIYLGENKDCESNQPLMLGKDTVDLLKNLVESLTVFMTSAQTAVAGPCVPFGPAPLPTINLAATSTLGILNKLKISLGSDPNLKDCKVTSKRNYTV